MFKNLFILLLGFIAGLAGNLLAGYIQQDLWQNAFTPNRLAWTISGTAVMLVFIAVLESQHTLLPVLPPKQ